MTDQKSDDKYRFIPYRKHDIVEMCLQGGTNSANEEDMRQFYYMLSSIFHFEFHKVIESLKDAYAATDPDSDTLSYDKTLPLTDVKFVDLLGGLLDKANLNVSLSKS